MFDKKTGTKALHDKLLSNICLSCSELFWKARDLSRVFRFFDRFGQPPKPIIAALVSAVYNVICIQEFIIFFLFFNVYSQSVRRIRENIISIRAFDHNCNWNVSTTLHHYYTTCKLEVVFLSVIFKPILFLRKAMIKENLTSAICVREANKIFFML